MANVEQNSGVSWQIGESTALREAFANGTALNNSADPTFHPVGMSVIPIPFDFIY